MVLKNIYIARHGYRSNWLPPPHPDPPTGIDSDIALAPHGVDQAVELGSYISTLDKKPRLIFSSPFYRCIQTSKPVSEKLGLKINLERGIGEWFRPDREIIPEPGDVNKMSSFFKGYINEEYDANSLGIIPSLKGESEQDVFNRCKKFVEIFIPFIDRKYPQVESVLLVTHAATKIALGMALLGYQGVKQKLEPKDIINGDDRLRTGSCSLDEFERDTNSNSWKLLMNGNTDFLSEGEEMNWNFESSFEAGSDEDIKARAEAQSRRAAKNAKNKEYDVSKGKL
ncbi:hypothetical protein PACTADRAFT_49425 [Pachysolen tannophilus NRRL Y-2460]|uniref:Transcription factor TFIIIC triple barrel domain-containing protein n=1 Tax=Pachysolen tannophilus NRRL Y-2460 TaxID=669874 RepID=A0A1E4TW99_PACTA|nr:hypothetical protein PACTADRAFT_49425 [Pachysolen tannophilus NRRL Y-2460]